MLENIVSPPVSGRMCNCNIVPRGGVISHDTSECQNSPLATLLSLCA